jgi:hypothetical protein
VQERIVRRSKLDWVIVRPVILTNGPKTNAYRVLVDRQLRAIHAKLQFVAGKIFSFGMPATFLRIFSKSSATAAGRWNLVEF